MDDKETLRVGAAVRRQRRSLGLTLAAVATRSGLSVPFLSQIENERARPSARSLDLVAEALETTTARLRAAADSARAVDVVRAAQTDGVHRVVRGRHQLSALEFTGELDLGREFQHRNDEVLYVAEGAAEVEAEGQAYRLVQGDTLFLSGGVRHRWRATLPGTRLLCVAVAEHIDATSDPRR
ncbi:helix-turn-helix domain-containing protein [Streptomyces sp. ITFR-16]|uniref:helix-turn-helix domain-containing protein n=1 Tax=Streptomyces sp. ITFR-16 TaxID=3075198 RepID=UPI00288AD492|nr:helix-turn-helix domain-containing protein [Streptomyces sp. ITFR-16]WNI25740.1 helix-turn-helix domain-containing protein [Streptomyces sp. ITFR-16]